MKKILFIITFVFCFCFCDVLAVSDYSVEKILKYNLDEYFDSRYSIYNYEMFDDLFGNEFILCDLIPSGYMIICKTNNRFMEGSTKVNNPYKNTNGEKIYLGFGNYYYSNDGNIYSILNANQYITEDDLYHYSIDFNERLHHLDFMDNTDFLINRSGSYVDGNGFTIIQDSEYFSNLYHFPANNDNSCGFIALSILLSYLDTYKNPHTVPNQIEGIDYIFVPPVANESFDIYDAHISLDWDFVPFPSIFLKELLIDYGHYFAIFNSYASDASCLKNTFIDYAAEYIPEEYLNFYISEDDYSLNKINHAKQEINDGIPVILVMLQYHYGNTTVEEETNFFHDIVAYGYKNDTFLCHLGWWNGTDTFTDIVVSNILLESIFYIEYSDDFDDHVCTNNLRWSYNGCSGLWCPCGEFTCDHNTMDGVYVDSHWHSYQCKECYYEDNSREYHNYTYNSGKYRCSICGCETYSCPHIYYLNNNYNSIYHYYECHHCHNTYGESHTLVYKLGRYRCSYCPYTSSSGGGIVIE